MFWSKPSASDDYLMAPSIYPAKLKQDILTHLEKHRAIFNNHALSIAIRANSSLKIKILQLCLDVINESRPFQTLEEEIEQQLTHYPENNFKTNTGLSGYIWYSSTEALVEQLKSCYDSHYTTLADFSL